MNEATLSSAKEWAADLLEVPADTDAVTARRAFWRLLPSEGFWPYEVHVEAATLFTARPATLAEWRSEAFQAENEDKIRAAIEKFAGQFFLLPPTDRKSRWLLLMKHAKEYPRLRIRLERLQLGLGVVCDHLSCSDGAYQIIQACTTLFVTLPTNRAAIRAKLLSHFNLGEKKWNESIEEARTVLPEIVHFAPDLLEELSNKRGIEARKITAARVRSRTAAMPQVERTSNWVRIMIAILMAIGVSIGFFSSASKSNRKSGSNYELRQISPQEQERARRHVQEMLEMNRRNKRNMSPHSTDPNHSTGVEAPDLNRYSGDERPGDLRRAPKYFSPGVNFPPGSNGPPASTDSEKGP